MRNWPRLIILSVLVISLWGCSTPVPPAPPTATRTPVPVKEATALPPTATPKPTVTLTPTPSPTATEKSTEIMLTPLPPDVNPLTGLKMDDEALLDRIPVAIKVSNSTEVRPQSGLSMADIVFEHFAEGGITRFTALFYGQDPGKVGSVRSGRLIDIEIPAMYGAIFGYSGSSAGVKNSIRNSDLFPDYIAAPDFGVGAPTFYRVPQAGKAFEHTLFSDPEALRALAEERGINQRPDYERFMTFSEEKPAGGEPIDYFEINYLANAWIAGWQYDDEIGSWRRSEGGVAHTDALTGQQLTAENVILVFAHHIETDIQEDTWGGGHMSIQIQVWGTGPALIFRDGHMYSGFWERWERNHMLTFNDGDQGPIPLKPGNHWVQLVPLDTVSSDIGENRLRFDP